MSNNLIFNPILVIFAVPLAILAILEIYRILAEKIKRLSSPAETAEDIEAELREMPNAGFLIKKPSSAARRHFVDDDLLKPRLRLGWNVVRRGQPDGHVHSDAFREPKD